MRDKTEAIRAFNDARRSYLFEGGKGGGRLSQLLDPEFDEDDRPIDIFQHQKPKFT